MLAARAALPTERSLVERARSGDGTAFDLLIQDRIAGLFRLALAILGDEAEAREATQEASLQAWRELPRLREVDRFDAWLGRILTNACRMNARGRRRRQVREIAVSFEPTEEGRIEGSSATLSGPAERSAELDSIQRAFGRLSVEQRTILALHHLEDRPVAEVATRLAISIPNAKWRLRSARAALERALEAER